MIHSSRSIPVHLPLSVHFRRIPVHDLLQSIIQFGPWSTSLGSRELCLTVHSSQRSTVVHCSQRFTLVHCSTSCTPVHLNSLVHSSFYHSSPWSISVHSSTWSTPVHGLVHSLFQSTVHSGSWPNTLHNPLHSSLLYTVHFSPIWFKVHSSPWYTTVHGILQSMFQSMVHSISWSIAVYLSTLAVVHSCPLFGPIWSTLVQFMMHSRPWSNIHSLFQCMVQFCIWSTPAMFHSSLLYVCIRVLRFTSAIFNGVWSTSVHSPVQSSPNCTPVYGPCFIPFQAPVQSTPAYISRSLYTRVHSPIHGPRYFFYFQITADRI